MIKTKQGRAGRALVLACSVALVATLALPSFAFADTAAEVQAEADAALSSLNAMQAKLEQASDDYEQALYNQEEAQAKADEAQQRLDEATQKISSLQERLGNRANSMYRSGAESFLDLLLGATSFQEFANNWSFLTIMNQNDANLVQETKELRQVVQDEKAEYDTQCQAAEEAVAEAERIKSETETTIATMQATYDSLSAEAAELLAEEEAAAAALATVATTENTNTASSDNSSASGSQNSSSSNVSYDAYVGSSVVDRAQYWVGKADYSMGACSPGLFDCSGFVSYCLTGSYSRLGSTYTFLGWTQVSDPQPGDVCVSATHCGIYVGNGQMIHAADYGVGVIYGSVQSGMIYVRY